MLCDYFTFLAVATLLCAIQAQESSKVHVQDNNKNVNASTKHIITSTQKSTINSTKIEDKKHVVSVQNFDEFLSEHPGALMRGFIVFSGLSVLVLIYIGVKTYRSRKASPPALTVRKYGVRARRTDMEMLPLPLTDEDEEDDTLFEAKTMQR